MDCHTVIQIVEKVALYTVQNLDLVPCRMPRVRKGLGHAVVGDGNRGMAPSDGGLDDRLGICESVHIAHFGMQVQLHALHRRGILPGLMLNHIDVIGVELNVLAVPGGFHLALNTHPHTGFNGTLQRPGLLGSEVFLHRHGVGVVRHVKAEPPHTGPPCLPALEKKDLSRHSGVGHFQIQIFYRTWLCFDEISHQHLTHRRFSPFFRLGSRPRCGIFCLRRLTGDNCLHPGKAVDRLKCIFNGLDISLTERDLYRELQPNRHLCLVDGRGGQLRPRQPQPQLGRALQFCEHFKKRDISRHDLLSGLDSAFYRPGTGRPASKIPLPFCKAPHSFSISSISASTSRSCGTL